MLQYSIRFIGFFLTLVGLRLMPNVLKEACEVNDIMLLFVTSNCWTRSFTLGYWHFYFSSVYDSNEDKNFYRENIISNEYVCCLSTINHILDSQPVTVVVILYYTKLYVDQLRWGTWTCFFTLRVYWPMSLTHNVLSRESLQPA